VAGATGDGKSNWTGTYSGNASCPQGLPATPQACSGQQLIFLDPIHNIGYLPIYTLDAAGAAQIAVVDLTVGATNPVIKTISLPGASRVFSTTFNPNNNTMLAEAESPSGVLIFEIDTATQSVTSVVPTPPLNPQRFGGILMDPLNNRAFVAGQDRIGILDTSTSPPTWNQASVVGTVGTDSLSLNLLTGMLFISGDGNNQIIDTTKSPLVPMPFNSTFGVTDGNSFDPATNLLLLNQEVRADQTWAFNFRTLNAAVSPATANVVQVPNVCPAGGTGCFGEKLPVGEGPGGEVAINCTTHQAVVADEYGQNLKLVQMPNAPVAGPLNNNGRPGSGVAADSASVFTIAGTVIPKGLVNGIPTQLGILGDPNSLAVDPRNNFAYMLADTMPSFHPWQPGATTPLFLVRVDLSHPVIGSSPTGGVDGATFWNPASVAIRLP
jgi:hypothetical protein